MKAARLACDNMEVSARVGAMIVSAVAARGVDPGPLCQAAGFDPESANHPAARISLAMEQVLWETAAEHTRNPNFDVLDYAIRTAPSLRVALERLARYSRLEHEAAIFKVVSSKARTRVEHSFGPGVVLPCRQKAEFTVASIMVIGREIVVGGLQPAAVQFIPALHWIRPSTFAFLAFFQGSRRTSMRLRSITRR
jgi:hypothetical protein